MSENQTQQNNEIIKELFKKIDNYIPSLQQYSRFNNDSLELKRIKLKEKKLEIRKLIICSPISEIDKQLTMKYFEEKWDKYLITPEPKTDDEYYGRSINAYFNYALTAEEIINDFKSNILYILKKKNDPYPIIIESIEQIANRFVHGEHLMKELLSMYDEVIQLNIDYFKKKGINQLVWDFGDKGDYIDKEELYIELYNNKLDEIKEVAKICLNYREISFPNPPSYYPHFYDPDDFIVDDYSAALEYGEIYAGKIDGFEKFLHIYLSLRKIYICLKEGNESILLSKAAFFNLKENELSEREVIKKDIVSKEKFPEFGFWQNDSFTWTSTLSSFAYAYFIAFESDLKNLMPKHIMHKLTVIPNLKFTKKKANPYSTIIESIRKLNKEEYPDDMKPKNFDEKKIPFVRDLINKLLG